MHSCKQVWPLFLLGVLALGGCPSHPPGQPVGPRDRIVLVGDFDIDATGAAAASDRRRLESMATQSGAHVEGQVTRKTTLVVVGRLQPAPPALAPAQESDPRSLEAHALQLHRHREESAAVEQARRRSIPVLTQDEFLRLFGYQRAP